MSINQEIENDVRIESTVEEQISTAPSKKKGIFQQVTFHLIWTALIVNLSSFFFGYQLGVLNSPKDVITKCTIIQGRFFQDCIIMSDFEWDVVNGVFTLGGLLGGLSGGKIADQLGRRFAIHITNGLLVIGSLLSCVFSNFYVFAFGRIVCGMGAGMITVVAPMYLAEISPTHLRGFIANLFEFSNAFAIMISQILGIPLSTYIGWRVLIGLQAGMSILHTLMNIFSQESPRWLYQQKRIEESIKTLEKLRGEDSKEELDSFKSANTNFVWRRTLIKPLLIGIGLHLSQAFSGINLIIFYSTPIFNSIGMKNAELSTAIVGAACSITTFIVGFVIEKFGRRPLLIIGEIIQIISMGLLSLSFIFSYLNPNVMGIMSLISMIFFMISFSFSLGPVPWIMIGEIFPNDARGSLVSIVTAVNWFSQFLVLISFSFLQYFLKSYTFLLYTAFLIIALIFGIFVVPETKNKSLEEITGAY